MQALQSAYQYLQTADYTAAWNAFTQLSNQYPREPSVHNGLSLVALEQRDFKLALRLNIKTIKLSNRRDASLAGYYINQSSIYRALNQDILAKQALHQSIRLSPSKSAFNHLGSLAEASFELHSAKKYYQQALALDANCHQTLHNLAVIQFKLGLIDQSIATLEQVLALCPNQSDYNMTWLASQENKFDVQDWSPKIHHCLQTPLKLADQEECYLDLCISLYCQGKFAEAKQYMAKITIEPNTGSYPNLGKSINAANSIAYANYMQTLLDFPKNTNPALPKLYLIGDSHVLGHAFQVLNLKKIDYSLYPLLVKGLKLWHCTQPDNPYHSNLQRSLLALPRHTKFALSIGEIDMRLDKGLYAYAKKHKLLPEQYAKEMINRFSDNLIKIIPTHLRVTDLLIFGVPALNPNFVDCPQDFIHLHHFFNAALKTMCIDLGCQFFDQYQNNLQDNSMAKIGLHLDAYHVKPRNLNIA